MDIVKNLKKNATSKNTYIDAAWAAGGGLIYVGAPTVLNMLLGDKTKAPTEQPMAGYLGALTGVASAALIGFAFNKPQIFSGAISTALVHTLYRMTSERLPEGGVKQAFFTMETAKSVNGLFDSLSEAELRQINGENVAVYPALNDSFHSENAVFLNDEYTNEPIVAPALVSSGDDYDAKSY